LPDGFATTARLAVKLLARDWRAGELSVLVIALLVAVTALTGVAFLTDRVGQAVEMRAAESLAADLRVASPRPLNPQFAEQAEQQNLQTARVTSMPSVVFAGEANTLAAIRAVTDGYPLRGVLKTSERLLGEVSESTEIPEPGEAWASPRLMARLGVDSQVEIEVGGALLTLTRVLDFRPDEGWSFVDLAPTLLINEADLAATQLIQPGSRVAYRLLISGDRGDIDEFKPILEEQLEEGEGVRDIRSTSPQIRSSMERAGRFLNLASDGTHTGIATVSP
jgi:putative ABC transport system permease protein